MASEKLSYEIAALYSGHPEIKKAFDDFAALNKQGAKVTENLKRLASVSQKTGEAVRSQRRGVAQLGMQMSQFTTQLQTGTSFSTAFAQQIGDVGFALSTMGGTLGRIGTAVAGFGGIVISLGVMALVDLFKSSEDAEEGLKELTAAFDYSKASAEDLKKANELLADSNKAVRDTAMAAARAEIGKSKTLAASAKAEIEAIQTKIDKTIDALKTPGFIELFARGTMAAYSGIDNVSQELNKQVIENEKRMSDINDQLDVHNQMIRRAEAAYSVLIGGMSESEQAIDNERDALNKLIEDRAKNVISEEYFEQQRAKHQAKIDELEEQVSKRKRKNKDDTIKWGEVVSEAYVNVTKSVREFGKEFGKAFDKKQKAEEEELTDAIRFKNKLQMLQMKEMISRLEEQKKAYEAVGMAVNNAFKNMLTAGASWRDGMRGIIQAVIDELWRMFVVQQIVGMVKKTLGGIFGPAGSPTQSASSDYTAFAGMKAATGGYPQQNKPVLVGERGPELFIPSSSGKIVANHNLGGGGGGMVINVDARGSSDPAAVRAQVQQGIMEAAPAIIAAAEQRTVTNLRRPRLGGAMQ